MAEEDDKEELGDGEVAPDVDSDGSGKSGDDDDDPAAAVNKVWQSEAVPCADDDPEAPVGGDRWANLTLEERFSAAPPAAAVPDRLFGIASASCDLGAHLDPVDYDWEAGNFVDRSQVKRLEGLLGQWRGASVRGKAESLKREDLDPWQRFAYDIAMYHEKLRLARVSADPRTWLKALRMFLTGTAGAGKSRTVRCCVNGRKELRREDSLARSLAQGVEAEEAEQLAADEAESTCSLAAPTGCASFHMRNGAATVHRVYGVPCDYCGPTVNTRTARFLERAERLRRATFYVIDEFSMVGRQLLGKIVFRANRWFAQCSRSAVTEVKCGAGD